MMSKIYIDNLDRTGGNGSRNEQEDWLDDNTTSAENEWTSAETTFYYWKAPPHKQRAFKRLYDRQHGKGSSDRSTELPKKRALADTKAFAAVLDLPAPVRERALHIMERIDFSSNNSGGKSYEKIILAVLSLTHDEHLSNRPPGEVKYDQRLIFDETFKTLMESNNIGSKELRGIREQVRSKSEFF